MYPQNLKSSIFPKKLFIPSCYAHALHSEMDPSMSLGMFAPESSLSNWPINAHNHQQIEIWTQITIYFDPSMHIISKQNFGTKSPFRKPCKTHQIGMPQTVNTV